MKKALIEQFIREARGLSYAGQLSLDALRQQFSAWLSAKFPRSEGSMDRYCYVQDVFPSFFVYSGKDGKNFRRSYSYLDGKLTVGDEETEVVQTWMDMAKEAWAAAQEQLAAPMPDGASRIHETFDGPLMADAAVETVEGAPVLKGVTLIKAGKSRNGRIYSAEVLRRDGPTVFEAVPAYVTNHNPADKTLNNLVGTYRSVRFEGDTLKADLHGLPSAAGQLQRAVEAAKALGPDRVGLSIDTAGLSAVRASSTGRERTVERLVRTEQTSVDLVINPAAGGRLTESEEQDDTCEESEVMKDKLKRLTEAVLVGMTAAVASLLIEGLTEAEVREANPALADKILAKAKETDPPAPAPNPEPVREATEEPKLEDLVETRVNERFKLLECQQTLAAKLTEARGLDESDRELVSAKFASRVFETADLDTEIRRLTDRRGRQNANRPNVGGHLQVTQESHDLHRLRLEAFFRQAHWSDSFGESTGQSVKDKSGHVVEPYKSFRWEILPQMAGINPGDTNACREAMGMMIWRGDLLREQELMARESVTAGTFDQAWADVMYRVLLDQVQTPELNSWKLWTIPVSFQDLTTEKKFVRFGGYGTFGTVSELGAYQPVTTPGDEQVSLVPSKYGGLEELSWEAILRDDVRLISRIPMAMGRGWAWTIYDLIYGALQGSSGNGPTMAYDSTALYNARAITNIVDSALAESSLNTGRVQMGKMAELSSGKRIMYRPRFMLYASPDLDLTAWNLVGQNTRVVSNSDATLPNFFGPSGPASLTPVPVCYPTATTQRVELVANPQDVETAYTGFLNGRSEPEVFVQDAELMGSRFTADKITIKLRGTAGFKPANHRAFQRIQNT